MNYSPIGSGYRNITNAGTPITLVPSSVPANRVDIQAKLDNLGIIYIGGQGLSSSTGIALNAGDVYSLESITDLILVNIDGSLNSDGVTYNWFIGEQK